MIVNDDKKPLPDEVETSNPVGALIVRFAVRLLAPTVKLCSADAVPAQVVKDANAPLLIDIKGEEAEITVKVAALLVALEQVPVTTHLY